MTDNAATKPTIAPPSPAHIDAMARARAAHQAAMDRHAVPPPIAGDTFTTSEIVPEPKAFPSQIVIHVLGLPHTISRKTDFGTCAFTQKVVKLCAMMHRRGHKVIHYGVAGAEVECSEKVDIITLEEWSRFYGIAGTEYYDISMDAKNAPYLTLFSQRLAAALKARVGEPHTEIIAMTWGGPQRDGAHGIPQYQVETGIGYQHSWSDMRVYESYAWLHTHLGMDQLLNGNKFYWSVIPNAFDLNEFTFNDKPGEDFLYMGRLIDEKGVGLACHIARMAGRKITIVGQGDPTRFLQGPDFAHVTYLPPVDWPQRNALLRNAYAVFCPTLFVEPFCGVHVEAMLCGTPVITTDWGVFSETVHHGVTGYRCRTFEQFVWAAKNVHKLDRQKTYDWARANFSLERIALMYEEYFQMVLNLKYAGFYTDNPNREQLDWLVQPMAPTQKPVDLSLRFVPPPLPPAPPPKLEEVDEWTKAQNWERHWWGLDWSSNWDDEIRKQDTYFRLIGFPDDRNFGNKTVLDVGCGPVSMLQRSTHGFSRGIDPLAVSEETLKRYRDAGVEFLNIKAEGMPAPGYYERYGDAEAQVFDEIWMYNLLQHTQDPHEIMRRMVACATKGTKVRIFEWIDLGICDGHPQNLTEDMFIKHFGGTEWDPQIWNVGFLRGFGGTATEKYIAIVVEHR